MIVVELVVAIAIIAGVVFGARAAIKRGNAVERIDPFTLTDPWRSFVQDAQQARDRFDRIASGVEDGPLKERLGDIARRVGEGVTACWRIAESGHRLHKMVLEVGVRSESESVARMRQRETETRDKLAVLVGNLDESVARAAELATGQLSELDSVAGGVEAAVSELEAMRLAVVEIDKA